MAMAKPIVATNIDGITEQISHEREGILVPIRKPEALAGAVSRIIEDNELATALGRAARKKVETFFSIEQMVREIEKVYLSLQCQ
jgi:glycosyltransferase involved in cell wall biosynthesis